VGFDRAARLQTRPAQALPGSVTDLPPQQQSSRLPKHLDRKGLEQPGFVHAPSGITYAFVFIGRSGTPFPSGLEIYAVVDALEPIDGTVLDRDLWSILRWMIDGVGAPRTVEDFDRTGRLYRVPAASPA
jgi:hypothetical protein